MNIKKINGARTLKILKKAQKITENHSKEFTAIGDELKTLYEMIQAWGTGKYKRAPWKTISFTIVALLYLIDPIDAIPDFIPALGFTDDLALFSFVLKSLKTDIQNFKVWKEKN